MGTFIHSSAIVSPKAQLGENVSIGPFCTVGDDVQLGNGVQLVSHAVVDGITSIGDETKVFPFAALGLCPQDLKYKGEKSRLEIGKRNRIREYTTMHTGTEGGGMLTKVGDDCLFMIGVHIAHDCCIGNNVVMANNATLAGHVVIGDFVVIGGLAAVQQFIEIGEHAMIGGMSGVAQNVIPYGVIAGERACLSGINLIGLERRGFSKEDMNALRGAYKMIFLDDEGTIADRMASAENTYSGVSGVARLTEFIRASDKGIVKTRN
ncbi:MAG: acyl-ACP--UDP-N-acetylglucosamine O-acyltransferase [Alphaproteobacteria bacterium]|nr:acyl-ACP--UDP-N-acetylglucosamine O-acyltransferase [Alphaproteobacteria bacterium]MCL2505878.1 acyl-ACP--UDP-N-acetylglucosamine O-acyltransferase [Alphaproteobacteria bacterium]